MLRLRPFRLPDAKEIINWTSAPEEFYKWTAGIMGEYPLCEKRLLEAVSAREDNTKYFPLVAFDENGLAGFFIVITPDADDRKVRFGFVIVNPSKRGKGYGKQMLKLGLKFVFEIYGADEVGLGVFDNNPAAYNCYKSVGFKENGIKGECELCGEKWTCIEMMTKAE